MCEIENRRLSSRPFSFRDGAQTFAAKSITTLNMLTYKSVRSTTLRYTFTRDDTKETGHLKALEGAEEGLKLFQMDLLDYDSIVAALTGTAGVFHLASPNVIGQVVDPEKELLEPAIKGTKNVLTAAKDLGVKRAVVTSSISSIVPSPNWPADVPKGEDCWTDEEYCRSQGLWYPLSKMWAEKAAWEVAEEKGMDVVVINPATVLGPVLPPILNSSMAVVLALLKGSAETYENFYIGCVHVKDVAMAHILLYENKSATGRHLCTKDITHFSDFAAKTAELYPDYKVPSFPKDTQPGLLRTKNAGKKLMDLGLNFTPMEDIIKDTVESLKSRGYLS